MTEQETNNTEAITGMKLDVKVRPITPKNNLMAFASVKINDCFMVDGLKVLTGEKGLFVNMPSVKDNKGEYHDVCFPVTADFRKQLNSAVLDGYTAEIEKLQGVVDAAKGMPDKPSIKEKLNEANKEIQLRPPAKTPDSPKKDDVSR